MLVSIGYEAWQAGDFVERLRDLGVATVVDVRLNAVSRKPGMSKGPLRCALGDAGIEYLHLPALGNPRDDRAGIRAGSPEARGRFARRLQMPDALDAIAEVGRRAAGRTVAVVCVEADHGRCHRSSVVEAVVEAHPRLAVVRA